MNAVRSTISALMLKKIRQLCLYSSLVMTAFVSANTLAQEQLFYTVEMIIVKHLTQTDEETWPKSISLNYPENLIFLDDGLQTLPADQETLKVSQNIALEDTNLHKRLKASRHFKVLYHQNWIQHIQDEASASNIVIRAGLPIEGVYPIAGSIKIFKSRYLHLRSNLWFIDFVQNISQLDSAPYSQFETIAKASNPDINLEQALQNVWPIPPQPIQNTDDTPPLWSANIERISQIKQKRRMRSNEVHYIDHPLYGIILEIRPVK